MSFSSSLHALREGEVSFPRFAADTAVVWQRFARYLSRRWKPPAGVDEGDLAQELLVAGWAAVDRWDPERGVSIERYVTFQAIDKAKKWLHRQRNAYRRDDSSASRAPIPFSSLARDDEDQDDVAARLAWHHPDADAGLDAADFAAELRAAFASHHPALEWRHRVALDVVADCAGDVDAAVARILSDPELSLALRVGSDEAASAIVRTSIHQVAGMMSGGTAT